MFGADARDNHHVFGMYSAMVLNLSLLGLPFAASTTWQALQNADVYSYAATPETKAKTRAAIEDAAGTLIPDGVERHAAWGNLVRRELDDNDYAAARGLLLSAPSMMPVADSTRFEAQVPVNADDKTRIDTALVFLDDDVRKKFDASGAAGGASGSNFSLLGDANDFAGQAGPWLRGERGDDFSVALAGVGLLSSSVKDQPARVGASIVKAARSTNKLTPTYTAHLQQLLFAALPPPSLRAALSKALSDIRTANSSSEITEAVESVANPAALAAVKAELADIKAIADVTSPAGAVQVLGAAQQARDLKRLRLIGEAGGDRAVAIAKRLDSATVLASAKGALKMSNDMMLTFFALGLCLFGAIGSVLFLLGQALLHEWRHGSYHAHDDDREAELAR